MLYPGRSDDDGIYTQQIRDKACTICKYVSGKHGKCRECVGSDDKMNFKNAMDEITTNAKS